MKIDNKVYDILKWIQRIVLPALAVLVSTILGLCEVDGATVAMVVGIITAVDTFLGSLLGISSEKYFKGEEAEK